MLALGYSADSGSALYGGLYTGVYTGEMVEAFESWCFDEARQRGDTGIVQTDYGYHLMYYVSDGLTEWQQTIYQELLDDAYTAALEDLAAQYPVIVDSGVLEAISL